MSAISALSVHQRALHAAVIRHWREHGYGPSRRDLQAACSISSTSVVEHNLRALERAGFIKMEPVGEMIGRAIVALDGNGRRLVPGRVVRVPLIGELRADRPIPVSEQ